MPTTSDGAAAAAAERQRAAMKMLEDGLKAESEAAAAKPSAFAEALRATGVQVTQHPPSSAAPAATPAPAPMEPVAPTAPVAPLKDEALDLLAAGPAEVVPAAPAEPAPDANQAWRQQQVERLVDQLDMPEAVARVLVSRTKRKDLEPWLASLDALGSEAPPREQGRQVTPATSGDSDEGTTDAAPAVGRQLTAPTVPANPELESLRSQVAALQSLVMGDRTSQARAEFARAAEELRGEFPAILRQDGTLDPEVAATGQQLRSLPAYQRASAMDLLRAAAAARFSAPRRGPDPVSATTQTPVSTTAKVPGPPQSWNDRMHAVMSVRSRYGDPQSDLGPENEAKVAAEIERMFPRRP